MNALLYLKSMIKSYYNKEKGEILMDIRTLQYFLTVAREESITRAAEFLHMTQPPLSRQLKDLEKELGKQLFIRGKRKITLTEEGQILRKRAEEIIQLMEITESEIRLNDKDIAGNIHIGCPETESMRPLIRIMKQIQELYPNIIFHITSSHSEVISERLDRGLLDFGVFLEPTNLTNYDFIRMPATETWGVLMRKDSPLASKDSIRIEDLMEVPLIVSNQGLVENEFAGWSKGNYEKLDIIATYNLLFNASLMVEEGMGYAICLDEIIPTTQDRSLCFRPLEPELKVGISIAWKKYQVFSKACEIFLKTLQNQDL